VQEAGRPRQRTAGAFVTTAGLCKVVTPYYYLPQAGVSSLERDTMRALALALVISVLVAPAHAQSLQINGKFGYLGEYELSATVSTQTSGAKRELAGPMTVKHVGLCTHSGPNESQGEITLQITDAKSPIEATLVFDGRQCRYKGRMSADNIGELFCSGNSVPFSIWVIK
jgi:hypothetical protein